MTIALSCSLQSKSIPSRHNLWSASSPVWLWFFSGFFFLESELCSRALIFVVVVVVVVEEEEESGGHISYFPAKLVKLIAQLSIRKWAHPSELPKCPCCVKEELGNQNAFSNLARVLMWRIYNWVGGEWRRQEQRCPKWRCTHTIEVSGHGGCDLLFCGKEWLKTCGHYWHTLQHQLPLNLLQSLPSWTHCSWSCIEDWWCKTGWFSSNSTFIFPTPLKCNKCWICLRNIPKRLVSIATLACYMISQESKSFVLNLDCDIDRLTKYPFLQGSLCLCSNQFLPEGFYFVILVCKYFEAFLVMVILRPMWICRILNIDIRKAKLSKFVQSTAECDSGNAW